MDHRSIRRHDPRAARLSRGDADRLRGQLTALGSAVEHTLDVLEACVEVFPELEVRVEPHLREARLELNHLW